MGAKTIVKFFCGWLKPGFFDEPGHWRRWRSRSYSDADEGYTLVVFRVPAAAEQEAVKAVEELLQEKFVTT